MTHYILYSKAGDPAQFRQRVEDFHAELVRYQAHCKLVEDNEAQPLRRFDDLAKVPNLEVPSVEHYRARLEATAQRKTPLAAGGVNRE